MFTQLLMIAALVCVSTRADAPSAQYLPPNGSGSGGNGGGSGAGGSGAGGSGAGGSDAGGSEAGGSGPGEEGGKPEPFSFSHGVMDAESGNDYSHKAESDGNVVKGEYSVLLPDGRRQRVMYTADSQGYKADVQYEGEAISSAGAGAGGAGSAGVPSSGRPTGGSGSGATRGASGSGFGSPGSSNGGGNGYPSGRPKASYLPPGK